MLRVHLRYNNNCTWPCHMTQGDNLIYVFQAPHHLTCTICSPNLIICIWEIIEKNKSSAHISRTFYKNLQDKHNVLPIITRLFFCNKLIQNSHSKWEYVSQNTNSNLSSTRLNPWTKVQRKSKPHQQSTCCEEENNNMYSKLKKKEPNIKALHNINSVVEKHWTHKLDDVTQFSQRRKKEKRNPNYTQDYTTWNMSCQ